MAGQFSRTALLIGSEGIDRLRAARIALFGVGGVGGFAAEALARAGVGGIDLFDNDVICESNLNRQLVALHSTLGQFKVDVMKARILDINPQAQVGAYRMFYLPENADKVDLCAYNYVIDCIDTVTAKVELAVRCQSLGIPLISSMGTGNKLDPTAFEIADIYQTTVCPLARVMRQALKKRDVHALKVVYSRENPRVPLQDASSEAPQTGRRSAPGSTSFCPSAAGLILAGEVIRELSGVR